MVSLLLKDLGASYARARLSERAVGKFRLAGRNSLGLDGRERLSLMWWLAAGVRVARRLSLPRRS